MWALQVDSVSKSYGDKIALDGVSLGVRAGEFVALLGPNGAGKSTLMQLLTGLFVADAGSIQVLGADMRQQAPQALAQLGVVFQQTALDLDLSVAANLAFHGRLHGMSSAELRERTQVCLTAVGLADQGEAVVRSLSGGNRRKVELARAVLHQPQLVLMDEATVGLDIASRQQLMQLVLQLRADMGVSTLWTTHLSEEARLADRIIVLHRGRVIFDGAPDALLQQTAEPDVEAAFLRLTA